MKSCAIFGHQIDRLNASEKRLRTILYCEILTANMNEFEVFITGLDRGVDMMAANEVLSLREKASEVKLICAVPYEGFERTWPERDRREYERIISEADEVIYMGEEYVPGCYQECRRWRLEHASRIIDIRDGSAEGLSGKVLYTWDDDTDMYAIVHYM